MPFTPFHEGPALLIGLILIAYIDLPTLLIASIIIDVEPLIVIVFKLNYPLHGYLHTFVGATIMGLITFTIMLYLRRFFDPILDAFKIRQSYNWKTIMAGSFIGVYKHILLDAPLYSEMNPFFPVMGNPLYGTISIITIYSFCTFSFIFAFAIYLYMIIMKRE